MDTEKKYILVCKVTDGYADIQPTIVASGHPFKDEAACNSIEKFRKPHFPNSTPAFPYIKIADIDFTGGWFVPPAYLGGIGNCTLRDFIHAYMRLDPENCKGGFDLHVTAGTLAYTYSSNRRVLWDVLTNDQGSYLVYMYRGKLHAEQIVEDCIIYLGHIIPTAMAVRVGLERAERTHDMARKYYEGILAADCPEDLISNEVISIAMNSIRP